MGAFHRYLERRRVLRLLAELEQSLCQGASRPGGFSDARRTA